MKNPVRPATVKDIAAKVGVSKTTAAAILREAPGFSASADIRRQVLEASIQLGYRRNAVASSLSVGRTHTIGLILPHDVLAHKDQNSPNLNHAYSQELFLAVFKEATHAGLRVLPISSQREKPTVNSVTDERRVDGVILSAAEPMLASVLEESGIAWVGLGSAVGPYHVHSDNEGGAQIAVTHFVELGHRRIVHWGGDPEIFAMNQRAQGFRNAISQQELSETTVVTTRQEVMDLLSLPAPQRPTAFFVYNDPAAIELMDMARNRGLRIPEDLSVIGFDNGLLADATRPALTTIHNPLDGQARAAIEILQGLRRGEEPFAHRIIPTYLALRQTTASPPLS